MRIFLHCAFHYAIHCKFYRSAITNWSIRDSAALALQGTEYQLKYFVHISLHIQDFTSHKDKENCKEKEPQQKSAMQKEMQPDLNNAIWGVGSNLRSKLNPSFLVQFKVMTFIFIFWHLLILDACKITSWKSINMKICWAERCSLFSELKHNVHGDN